MVRQWYANLEPLCGRPNATRSDGRASCLGAKRQGSCQEARQLWGTGGREFKSPAPTNQIKHLRANALSKILFGVPVGFPGDVDCQAQFRKLLDTNPRRSGRRTPASWPAAASVSHRRPRLTPGSAYYGGTNWMSAPLPTSALEERKREHCSRFASTPARNVTMGAPSSEHRTARHGS